MAGIFLMESRQWLWWTIYQVYAFNKQGIKATYSSSILLMIFIVYQSVLVVYTSIIMLLKFVYFSKLYSGFFFTSICWIYY